MTNRKLKKKIRQAFAHATPDLAESISVRSLLSDVVPKKRDEKPTKPMKPTKPDKTPIQFRALATLAASIAVVALLASMVSMLNPFAPSDSPISNTGPTPDCEFPIYTDPSDKVQIDSDYTNDADFDWSEYYPLFTQHIGGKETFFQRTVQLDGINAYILAMDYQSGGECILIDATTKRVLGRQELIGSLRAEEPLARKYGYFALSYVVTDWNFAFVEDILCYDFNVEYYGGILTARVNAVSGAVFYDNLNPPDSTEPLNTDGPPLQETDPTAPTINDFDALYIALDHAGLQKDDIYNYNIDLELEDAVPHWKVTLYQTDCKYEYEIEYRFGEVLKVEKVYAHNLPDVDLTAHTVAQDEAIRIATSDSLINKNASVNTVSLKTENGISVYKIYYTDNIYWYRADVSSSLGIVLKVEISNRNYHFSVDHDEYISTIYPDKHPNDSTNTGFDSNPDRLTENQALYAALKHAGLARDDINESTISTSSAYAVPHWEVLFRTADYAYEYEIGLYTGEIIRVEREYMQKLSDNDVLSSIIISNDAAIEIAKNDPLMTDSTIVSTVAQGSDSGNYSIIYVRITGNEYVYEYKIASSYSIVTDLEITGIDYFDGIDDTPAPPDGKIGEYNAIDAALRYAGLTFDDVKFLECNAGTEDRSPQPHYDVTFFYDRCQWHYLIGMYNSELLSIERIPLFD